MFEVQGEVTLTPSGGSMASIQDFLNKPGIRKSGLTRSEVAVKALEELSIPVLELRLKAQDMLRDLSDSTGDNSDPDVVAFITAIERLVELDTHIRDKLLV